MKTERVASAAGASVLAISCLEEEQNRASSAVAKPVLAIGARRRSCLYRPKNWRREPDSNRHCNGQSFTAEFDPWINAEEIMAVATLKALCDHGTQLAGANPRHMLEIGILLLSLH